MVLVTATLLREEDLTALQHCLASLAAQDPSLCAVGVSWHGSTPALVERAKAVLSEVKATLQIGQLFVVEAEASLQTLEHVKLLLGSLPQDIPAHTWVKIVDHRSLLSPKHAAVLLPVLRLAAPDQRVVAVSCLRRAELKAKTAANAPAAVAAAEVEALLACGAAQALSSDDAEAKIADLAVRLKNVQSFVEQSSSGVLARGLCGHRFRHKLANTFGKRVQAWALPAAEDREWMRWSAAAQRALPQPDGSEVEGLVLAGCFEPFREADRQRAKVLADGCKQHRPAGPDGQQEEEQATPGSLSAASVEEATRAMATLRHRIERWLIVCGEEVSSKELRSIAADEVQRMLEEVGLGQAIGLARWVRETAEALATEAAAEFGVRSVPAQT